MKLSIYIEGLRQALSKYGDLKVIYARDDEGNGYCQLYHSPSVRKYKDGEFQQEEIESDEFNAVCIN